MCGRYVLRHIDIRRFGATLDMFPPFEEFTEKVNQLGLFNIAPSQLVPAIRQNQRGHRTASLMRWGFIPSWTKGKPAHQPINARAETAATSAMFRQAIEQRRCLLPADGFYEWKGSKAPKQPYFIHLKNDATFAFAGIWERWKPDKDAEPIETVAIITTRGNELMQPIHHRMPVILDEAEYVRWLDAGNGAAGVGDLLKPMNADRMEAWPVSAEVNRPGVDKPSLIERVIVAEKKSDPTLFGKDDSK